MLKKLIYGTRHNDILEMSERIDPKVRDEFFNKQLRYEKLAKNVGILGASVFIGSIIFRAAVYERALTNQDECLLVHRMMG